MWRALQRRIDEFLEGVTLAGLLADEMQVESLLAETAGVGSDV
jgi:hypothetical protein